jgi:sRNA-binding protein
MGEDAISISDKKVVKVDDFADDMLSDEERNALKEDIEGEDKPPAGGNDGGSQAAEKEAEAKAAAEKAKADKAAAEKAKAEKEAADKAAADAAAAAAKKGDEVPPETKTAYPLFPSGPPLALKTLSAAELQAVNSGMEAVKKKFHDGEIDYDEYMDERLKLERRLWNNDMANQISAESVESQWQWEQQGFLTAKENAWINDDDVVYAAFAATVNRIMSTQEGAVMPGHQLLNEAKAQVAARFKGDVAAGSDKAKAAEALKAAKADQAGKAIPETLGGKPAAEIDGGVGEFDYLDKLDGEDFEQAVAKLTEDQLARYEATH